MTEDLKLHKPVYNIDMDISFSQLECKGFYPKKMEKP